MFGLTAPYAVKERLEIHPILGKAALQGSGVQPQGLGDQLQRTAMTGKQHLDFALDLGMQAIGVIILSLEEKAKHGVKLRVMACTGFQ